MNLEKTCQRLHANSQTHRLDGTAEGRLTQSASLGSNRLAECSEHTNEAIDVKSEDDLDSSTEFSLESESSMASTSICTKESVSPLRIPGAFPKDNEVSDSDLWEAFANYEREKGEEGGNRMKRANTTVRKHETGYS